MMLIKYTQPHPIGGERKSLAVTLPVKITRAMNIDEDTPLQIVFDEVRRNITIRILNTANEDKTIVPVGQGFQALYQQAQSGSQ